MRFKAFFLACILLIPLPVLSAGAPAAGADLPATGTSLSGQGTTDSQDSSGSPDSGSPGSTGGLARLGTSTPVRLQHHLEIRDFDPVGHRFSLVLVLDLKPGFHTTLQEDFLWLRIAPRPGISTGKPGYSRADRKILDAPVWDRQGTISLPLELDPAAWQAMEGQGISLDVQTSWQICDESGQCFLPETSAFAITLKGNPPELSVPGAGGKTLASQAQQSALAGTGTSGPGANSNPPPPALPDLPGILLMLLFAFLGGLILNVMPCVLPVLSLKVLSLMDRPGQEGEDGARLTQARKRGLAGSSGMLATMIALGGLVLTLRAGGQAVGWGFQFQNPHFVVILVLVVLVLAMSMMGTWQLRLPSRGPHLIRGKDPLEARKSRGLGKSFADGILMVVMATPCSAPFLGSAMGFALAATPLLAMAGFLCLGIGLALPYFLLAWFPVLRGFMPKPGAWMDSFKTVLAFLLLGTAAWLSGISIGQLGTGSAGGFLALLAGVAFAVWIFGQSQARTGSGAWVLRGLALAGIILSLVLFYPWNAAGGGGIAQAVSGADSGPAGSSSPEGTGKSRETLVRGGVVWQEFSPQAVAAAQEGGKPVFIDFGAAWCITCGVNEKGILSDPAALAGLAGKGTVFFQGDYTLADPAILSWMQDWGRAAVPFYQVLKPDGTGLVLPELLAGSDLDKAAAWLDGSIP